MKTTIEIDGELLAAAKRRAEAAGLTVDAFVEEALREKVGEQASAAVRGPGERAAMLELLPRAPASTGDERHWTRDEIYRERIEHIERVLEEAEERYQGRQPGAP